MTPEPDELPARPSHARHLYAWFRLVHPFPSLLVTFAAVLFAFAAAHGNVAAQRLLAVGISMLSAQCAIGSANDVMDRDLDCTTKRWKPLARGAVSVRAATRLAIGLSLLSLLSAALLGSATLLAASVGLGCGLLYDLRLKRSRWSWLPYGVGLPTLPVFALVAVNRMEPRLLLVYPLGVLLGLALHLANTLPDLEGDRAFGVRGLAHGLGLRRSLLLCYGSLLLAQALTLLLAPFLHYHGVIYPAGLALSLLLTAAAAVLYRIRPGAATLQTNFGVLAIAVLALAFGWLAGTLG